MNLYSINPATNKLLNKYRIHSDKDIKSIIDLVMASQKSWEKIDLIRRLDFIKKISLYLKKNVKYLAKIITSEMGKPISQSILEIEKCVLLCEYYLNNSLEILSEVKYDIRGQKSILIYQPLGVILGIMPWNFPFWQVFRYVIPTLIVGNGVLLKHSSNVQGCAKAIEECFISTGFPNNIFRNIILPGSSIHKVIKNPNVAAVTLTGSNTAGISVATSAGSVLKKTVLELGGSDPYVILSDADINNAVDSCINGRILNAGQSCISAKRIIVMSDIYDDFIVLLEEKLLSKKMGDPLTDVDLGPMVSYEARDEVHEQVLKSIKVGAKLILGGKIPKIRGAYYPITLLTNVVPGMPAFDEEIFGPVFSIIKSKDEENSINLANLSEFGLGASIFTKDLEKGEYIAKTKISAGSCFVNDFVKSDPRLPFGGVKKSGYGRELASQGMLEFVNMKTIVVKNT